MGNRNITQRRSVVMRITTINIPGIMRAGLDALIDAGYYPSRSEAIRVAIRDFFLTERVRHELLGDIPVPAPSPKWRQSDDWDDSRDEETLAAKELLDAVKKGFEEEDS